MYFNPPLSSKGAGPTQHLGAVSLHGEIRDGVWLRAGRDVHGPPEHRLNRPPEGRDLGNPFTPLPVPVVHATVKIKKFLCPPLLDPEGLRKTSGSLSVLDRQDDQLVEFANFGMRVLRRSRRRRLRVD